MGSVRVDGLLDALFLALLGENDEEIDITSWPLLPSGDGPVEHDCPQARKAPQGGGDALRLCKQILFHTLLVTVDS